MYGKACICPLCTFSNAKKVTKRYGAVLQWLNISAQSSTLPSIFTFTLSISTFTLSIFSSVGPLVCRSRQESFSQFCLV